ncbi:MAG: DUF1156 domain-containing protein [Armatimonadetes bacterium]|nr:DUF1156 domain-containing protein [Armatimonadota bacterium]
MPSRPPMPDILYPGENARRPVSAAHAASRFPLAAVNALAALENHNKHLHRPTHYVHKWWARRPGSVFRALLLSLLLPPEEDVWERYYTGVDLNGAVLLDPFMGGGTTVAEALRLGCRVIGSDLNPVAYWTAKMVTTRADPRELAAAFARVEAVAAPTIRARYETECATCGAPAEAQYILWVNEPPCERCGAPVPLHPGWVVARRAAADLLCPTCEWVFRVPSLGERHACPRCGAAVSPALPGYARGRRYRCPGCGHDGLVAAALAGLTSSCPARPLALLVVCPHHEPRWQAAMPCDRAAAQSTAVEAARRLPNLLCPTEPIPPGVKTSDLHRHGCDYWRDLFFPRQLLCLDALLRAVLGLPPGAPRDLLVTLFSGCLEFNNRYCTYKGGHPRQPGAVRHLFSHHAFVFPRWPLENHL